MLRQTTREETIADPAQMSGSLRCWVASLIFMLLLSPANRCQAQTVGFFPPASLSSGSTIRSGTSSPASIAATQFGRGVANGFWFVGDQLYGTAQVAMFGLTGGKWTFPNPPTHPASAAYDQLLQREGSHLGAAGAYYRGNLPNYMTLGAWSVGEAIGDDLSDWMLGEAYRGRIPEALGNVTAALITGRVVCAPLIRGGRVGGRGGAAETAAADTVALENPKVTRPSVDPLAEHATLVELGETNLESHPLLETAKLEVDSVTVVKWPPDPTKPHLRGHGGLIIRTDRGPPTLAHLQKDPKTGAVGVLAEELKDYTLPKEGAASSKWPRVIKECKNIPPDKMSTIMDRVFDDMFQRPKEAEGLYQHYDALLEKLRNGETVSKMANCNAYVAALFDWCVKLAESK